jgi:hypothetical protein
LNGLPTGTLADYSQTVGPFNTHVGSYIFTVTCTDCAFQGKARQGPSGASYKLPDDTTARVKACSAWCADCATVVDAERLPEISEIESELEALSEGGDPRAEFLERVSRFSEPPAMREYRLASLRSTLSWRRLRQAPARCLTCGSHALTYLQRQRGIDFPSLRHPGCGGMLQLEMHMHVSGHKQVLYSVEGLPIA